MSANATAKVTVKLLDQLSGPANLVRSALRGIRGDMASLKGANLGISKQIDEAANRAQRLRSSLLSIGAAGLVSAYALKRVMKPSTSFETVLTDIRQKADLSAAATKSLGDRIKELAPKVNKSAGDVAKGVDTLMGAGMDPETAFSIMPAIGKTASAYRAEVDDIASASFSVIDNMKVPANQLSKALDIMSRAGKEGRFELKAMAQEFPSLTAAANALGINGTKGVAKLSAALQVARKGAGSDSEAATNVKNLMQKLQAEDAVKKWKKLGVDIRKEVKKTQAAGGDVFVMIAELIKSKFKGDISKLGDVYQDAQVQDFLRPLIEHLQYYKDTRDKAAAAEGVVEADYKIRMETFQAVVDRTSQVFEKLAVTVGESLMPILTSLADKLGPLVSGVAEWVSANQQLAAGALAAAAGLLALAGIGAAVKLLGAGLSLFGLKGVRGLLNYVAPKAAAPVATAATTAATGAAAKGAATAATGAAPRGAATPATSGTGAAASAGTGAAAKAGSTITTANKARVMTAGEMHAASRGAAAVQAGHAAKVAAALGEVGPAATGFLSKSLMLVSRLANVASLAEITFRALEAHSETTKENAFARLDPNFQSELERSRRVQDERKRDPEGARGRAMADRDRHARNADGARPAALATPPTAVSDASVGANSKATGTAAGAEVGQGIKDGLAAQAPGIEAAAQAIMARVKALFSAGVDIPVRPKLEGGGAALRAIHSDTGIN